MSVLDVVIAISVAGKHAPVLRRSRELIAAICDNTWKAHDQLPDDHEIDRFYPLGRQGVRHQLYVMMLTLIVPLMA